MSTVSRIPATAPSSVRKVIVASLIGTSLEWYDFFIYGTAAALVFNKLFFPELRPAGRHPAGLRDLRRRVHRPAARRSDLRPLRRQARPQERPGGDPAADGHRHVRDRPDADLRHDRRVGADPAGRCCASCRASASAASGAARC